MASQIDPTKPTSTHAFTADVRSNFTYTKQEIEALQSTYAQLDSPTFVGSPSAPTASPGDNDNTIATTAFVQKAVVTSTTGVVTFNNRSGVVTLNQADVTTVLPASTIAPAIDGTATIGVSNTWARADHIHPTDTTRAPIASPTFTGDPKAPTPAVGDNDTSIATTAFVVSTIGATHSIGRNLIHNGLFNVWQRGTGPFSATAAYSADRWQITVVTDTVAITRQVFPLGNLTDEEPNYVLRNVFVGNSAAGAFNAIGQPIEDVTRLSNKSVTVTFYAAAAAGTPKLGVSIDQFFGSGGSPSAQVNGTGQSVTLGAAYTRYTMTFNLATAASKTMGTNGNDCTVLNFWFSSGTTNATRSGTVGVQAATISIWGVQLEVGTVATPLEKPDPRYDLANCQRFFQTGSFYNTGYGAAGGGAGVQLTFLTTMRITPTVALSYTTQSNCASSGPSNVTAFGFVPYTVVTAQSTFALAGTFTASADL